MTLYSHKTLFQPQALRAKKQTFSNGGLLPRRAESKQNQKQQRQSLLF
jgi:hypothetical protein